MLSDQRMRAKLRQFFSPQWLRIEQVRDLPRIRSNIRSSRPRWPTICGHR